ncbi:glutamate-cysteine ligase family protein [Tistrella sp. BH-R2-4]|uniref:Glutamate-cysteine ligase family protein n=1 Tax=Tistrella arctica TaxID=3133430 RepID=A0ABU9YMA6_9PROT
MNGIGWRAAPVKVGVEVELPVASEADGHSLAVPGAFSHLLSAGGSSDGPVSALMLGGALIGLRDPSGMISVDNGFNNLEASLGPEPDLAALDASAAAALDRIGAAVAAEGGMLVNLAEHPFQATDAGFYARTRAPKPVYDYWNQTRGWVHASGIDAKAHNSPSTDVEIARGADAVNIVLGFSAAFIALFANSPFENGAATGFKENRLTLWPRMCGTAHAARDRICFQPPAQPFNGLGAYLRWALGMDAPVPALPFGPADLAPTSKIGGLVEINGTPSLRQFLTRRQGWAGRLYGDSGAEVMVTPTAGHFAAMQSSNFLDARLRFTFSPDHMPDPADLVAAIDDDDAIAALMGACTRAVYLEGRAPGANLPDRDLIDRAGPAVAGSVVNAAGALQKGLLANPDRALSAIDRHGWGRLMALRTAAIRDAMAAEVDGLTAAALAAELVEIAASGLDGADQRFLAYPDHVCRTGQSGADRAIAMVEAGHGSMDRRLRALVTARRHVPASLDSASRRGAGLNGAGLNGAGLNGAGPDGAGPGVGVDASPARNDLPAHCSMVR